MVYIVAACLLVGICASPSQAFAFKFDSLLTDGCHEMITVAAVQDAGWPDGRRAPRLVGDEVFVARDLPCQVRGSKDDAWVLSLVIGNRWNDLHGYEATDLPGLADVHGDPDDQAEHCLRGPEDDGPEGDAQALSKCQRFILARVDAALAGLDVIDLDERTTARVALSLQGSVEVPLQRYGFEMGRALHALQDSFAHTLRSPDGMHVRHVLNYVDVAHNDDYRESRDGHSHINGLDLCIGTAPRRKRRALATQASRELLEVLAQPGQDHETRRRAAEQVVSRWLSHEPGCTRDNDYCGAAELQEPDGGCSVGRARGLRKPRGAGLLVGLLLALWFLKRRACAWFDAWFGAWFGAWSRVERAAGRTGAGGAVALLLTLLAAQASRASAQSASPPAQSAVLATDFSSRGSTTRSRVEPSPFGVTALGALAIDQPALAFRMGGRYRINDRYEVALQLEDNPWYSLETEAMHAGVLSLFGSLSLDWLQAKGVTLRSTAHLGVTWLLFDLFGAPQGSWGPLVGLSLVGLSFQLDDNFRLLVEPAEVMMPIVQLEPVPYYYRQYRFALGLQWNP